MGGAPLEVAVGDTLPAGRPGPPGPGPVRRRVRGPQPHPLEPAFAPSVGLPDVIAHGMFTMGAAPGGHRLGRRPGRGRGVRLRFTKPVVVPDDEQGAAIEVAGVVRRRSTRTRR